MPADLPCLIFFRTGWSYSMVKGLVNSDDWDCGNGICSLEGNPNGCWLDDVTLQLKWS